MYIIYIIFFCFYFVEKGHGFSSSEFKYIDVLPEKEKQELMEKVARRILSEIKPKGPPKEKSIVLSDDELNKNSDYVNKVIKEESLKFESTRKTATNTNSSTIKIDIKRGGADDTDVATAQYLANYDKLQEVQAKDINDGIDKNITKDDETIVKSKKSELLTENGTSSILSFNLTKLVNKRIRRNNDKNEKQNSKESKNYEYDYLQVPVKPVLDTNVKQAQSQELNLSLTTETKQFLNDFEGSNENEATTISIIQNLNQTFVKRTDKTNLDLIIPADFENNKSTLFETTTEEHAYINHKYYKNENSNPEVSKNNNYEQIGDYKATTSSVIQNRNNENVLTNASEFFERVDKKNNLDLIILEDFENNKTTLSETEIFYTNRNKSTDKMTSATDLFEPENIHSTYSKTNTTPVAEITVARANQIEKNNATKPLRSLDSESDVKKKTNEAKLIDNNKKENLVKDIPPIEYLKILKTKYVETLPPDLGHVEVQIPKSVVNIDKNLSHLQKNVQRYDVFEVEPDESSLHLPSVKTNKNNQEAPYYAPVHDYAPENAFFNAFNRLGPSNDNKDHNVLEVGPDQFSLRSLSKNSNQGEPEFVPVHVYEPANAYFNPQNRLGPNNDDEEQSKNFVYRKTDENVSDNNFNEDVLRYGKDNNNVNRTFDFGIKKKPKDQKYKAVSVDIPVYMKHSKTASPDDYLDMDYFFGRSQTKEKYHTVNTFVSKLPSKEVGIKHNLKINLKRERIKSRTDLVSRILKELKDELKTSKTRHGFAADYYWSRLASGSIENDSNLHVLRSKDKNKNFKNILRNKIQEAKNFLLDMQVYGNNYVDYDELPTKVAYFKEKKEIKTLTPIESIVKSADKIAELSEVNEKLAIKALANVIKGIIKLLPPNQLEKLKNFKPTASTEVIYNKLLPFIKSIDTKDDYGINPKVSKEITQVQVKHFVDGLKKIAEAILNRIPPETLEKLKSLKGASKETVVKEMLPLLTKTDDTKQDDDTIKPKDGQENNDEMIPEESKNDVSKPKGSQEIDKLNVDVEVEEKPKFSQEIEKLNINVEIPIQKRKKKFLRTLEEDNNIEPYVEALKKLIKNESEGLKKYNWLGTTVDLQAALNKLIDLTESDSDEVIHPNDKSILKYIQFLYESAQDIISANPNAELQTEILHLKKGKLPRNLKRKKYKRKDAIAMFNDLYKLRRIILVKNKDGNAAVPDNKIKEDKGSKRVELQHFLVDLRSGLNQFHNALKHISLVTKYENQNWYKNLKELYMGRPKRKQFLEILLHLFCSRLYGLIEASTKNGLKQDVIAYVLQHKKEVNTTKSELVLVIKILNEIKKVDGVS